MNPHDSISDPRINPALDHIAANLGRDIDLHTLARLASLSYFHFHRTFTAVTGETPSRYILRKRLELAASQLRAEPLRPVKDIALSCGFSSLSLFCRNFKHHFGLTPDTYRRSMAQPHSNDSQLPRNANTHTRTYFHYLCSRKTIMTKGEKTMECNFEIRPLDDIHVIYCRHCGPYTAMQQAFDRLLQWASPRGLADNATGRLAAIYHDNPDITEPSKLISDACLIIPSPVRTDSGIGSYTINGGKYAIGRFEIAWDEFRHAWDAMYSLIASHGCRCCGLPFERYINNCDTHPDRKWIIDICIPVEAV